MNKSLLIIFVKNIKQGKVKTRLAKTIGKEKAFHVYKYLVEITERATQSIKAEKHIYFSDAIIEEKWPKNLKFIQKGEDLGQKMQNSIENGFKSGFEKIVLIGSDLPDISSKIIEQAFHALDETPVVFGPAEDGGYYLVGMTQREYSIFENKPWSQGDLLETTTLELKEKKIKYSFLQLLNDVDTMEDLEKSSIYNQVKVFL